MATMLRNNSGGPLILFPYGSTYVMPGQQVILADTLPNVIAALGPAVMAVVTLNTVQDGQLGAIPAGAGGLPGTVVRVPYTATGSEGTDITVSIGRTMASSSYGIDYAERGNQNGSPVGNLEVVDFPLANRTPTSFRVVFSAQPAANDQFEFFLYP